MSSRLNKCEFGESKYKTCDGLTVVCCLRLSLHEAQTGTGSCPLDTPSVRSDSASIFDAFEDWYTCSLHDGHNFYLCWKVPTRQAQ